LRCGVGWRGGLPRRNSSGSLLSVRLKNPSHARFLLRVLGILFLWIDRFQCRKGIGVNGREICLMRSFRPETKIWLLQERCRNPTLAKCEGEAQHLQSWGFGVLRDSCMFRTQQQGPNHLALGCSWCHWKDLEA
jgi:hypothetical protein